MKRLLEIKSILCIAFVNSIVNSIFEILDKLH